MAKNVADLHASSNKLTKDAALDEKGAPVNRHDTPAGSDPAGNYSTAGGDTTCGNWTKSDAGSATVGHHDRVGLNETRHMRSWSSSHGTRGCSAELLETTGGEGLLYCFLAR